MIKLFKRLLLSFSIFCINIRSDHGEIAELKKEIADLKQTLLESTGNTKFMTPEQLKAHTEQQEISVQNFDKGMNFIIGTGVVITLAGVAYVQYYDKYNKEPNVRLYAITVVAGGLSFILILTKIGTYYNTRF